MQFLVDADVASNFELNTAYELVMTVKDPIANNTVAVLTFPFELQQPTLDITRDTGNFTQWTTDANGEELLMAYGAYKENGANWNMYLPLYEAFKAWTKEYTEWDDNAEYYTLEKNVDDSGYSVLMGATAKNDAKSLNPNLKYSTNWADWNTYVVTNKGAAEKIIPVKTTYSHYGVYPEKLFTGGNTDNQFNLVYASLLKNSSMKMADGKETLVVNTGTHDVFISNEILNLTTPMKGKFFLFDGIDADGKKVERKTLNEASFNEDQRGFMTVADLFNTANFTAKAKNGATTYTFTTGTIGWSIEPETGKVSYTVGTPDATRITIYEVPAYSKRPANRGEVLDPSTTMVGAVTGGIVIQLPTSVADQEEVEITLTVKDDLGFSNALKFVVKKIQ